MATGRQRRKRRRRREAGAPAGAAGAGGGESGRAASGSAAVAAARSKPAGAGGRRGAKDTPSAPWGSFPLSEIVVFVAIVLLIGGFFVPPPRGAVMLGAGLALGSLAGLELAGREHFAGYRSHTMVLAGAVGVIVIGTLYALDLVPLGGSVAAGAVAFGLAAWAFASAFRRRSGGAVFKFKA